MKSKDALEYIAKEKGIDNITQEIKENWKMYQPCFQIIEKDLDRLEKLEQAFKIIWEELDLYMVALENEYELCATWKSSNIDKEKGRLLREVLEDVKY